MGKGRSADARCLSKTFHALIMNVLWFIEGRSVPASRYRAIQLFPYLEKHGLKIKTAASRPEKYSPNSQNSIIFGLALVIKIIVRLFQISLIFWADIVIIQRELTPYGIGHLELLIAKLHKKVIFDYDDALEISYRAAHPFIQRMGNEQIFQKLLKSMNLIIVGNKMLSQYAEKFNQNIVIIPTTINTDLYLPITTKSNKIPVIGWMGTSGKLKNLKLVSPALNKLSDERFKFKLRIISNEVPRSIINNHPFTEFTPWSAESEIKDLQNFDIGIMPLEDTEWNRGKCGFKLIQYMSVGLATVSSPVGVNEEIITNSINGFSAKSPDEWYTALKILLADQNTRIQQGKNARKTIEDRYSLKRWTPKIFQNIKILFDKNL